MKNAELLNDPRVVKEIEKHKWFESEKAKKDIGFDKAAQDWLERFSETWKSKNLSTKKTSTRSAKRYGF